MISRLHLHVFILFIVQLSCSVLKNDYNERALDCGLASGTEGHYVRVFDPNGEPFSKSQVIGKVLDQGVIVETIDFTSKGCFRAPDQGFVIIRSQDLKLSRSLNAAHLKATSKLVLVEDQDAILLPSEPLKDRRTYFGQDFYFVDPGYVLNFYSNDNLKNIEIEYCLDEIKDPEAYDFSAMDCPQPKYFFMGHLPRLDQGLWSVRYRKLGNLEGAGWQRYLLAVRVECEGVLRDIEGIAATRCTDIDNLEIKGPGSLEKLKYVSRVTGYLKIQENDSTSLRGIRNISSAGDFWVADMSALKSLDTMPRGVKGTIYIGGNLVLENVDGLSHLEKVERDLSFWENPALISLAGMRNIKSVGGDLSFFANVKVKDMDDLRSLEHVGGALSFVFSEGLQSIKGLRNVRRLGSLTIGQAIPGTLEGLENLQRVDDSIDLEDLVDENLEVFSKLEFVGKELKIKGGNVRTLHGLRNLKYVHSLTIAETRISRIDAFEAFERLDGTLSLNGNRELVSLEGFRNLKHIGEFFYLVDNPLLTSVAEFGRLETIGRSLTINGNVKLASLEGFSGLHSVEELFMKGNTELVNLDSILGLESVEGRISIEPFALCQNSDFKSYSGKPLGSYCSQPPVIPEPDPEPDE